MDALKNVTAGAAKAGHGRQSPGVVAAEAAALERVRFSLKADIEFARTWVPSDVAVAAPGVISWSLPWCQQEQPISRWYSGHGRGKRRVTGLLEDFVTLRNGDDRDIALFVDKWGCLGIEASEQDVELPPDGGSRRTAARVGWPGRSCATTNVYREECKTYREWSRRVQALLDIGDSLSRWESGSPQDWELWERNKLAEPAKGKLERKRQMLQLVLDQEGDWLKWKSVEEHPHYIEAAGGLEAAQHIDGVSWRAFQDSLPLSRDHAAAVIGEIVNNWVAVKMWYRFEEGSGFLPVVRMSLAENMQDRFWLKDLEGRSVLLALGQAVLHRLRGEAGATCGVCGEPVPEPRPQTRRGRRQFCSDACREEANRVKVRLYQRNRRAGVKKLGIPAARP